MQCQVRGYGFKMVGGILKRPFTIADYKLFVTGKLFILSYWDPTWVTQALVQSSFTAPSSLNLFENTQQLIFIIGGLL